MYKDLKMHHSQIIYIYIKKTKLTFMKPFFEESRLAEGDTFRYQWVCTTFVRQPDQPDMQDDRTLWSSLISKKPFTGYYVRRLLEDASLTLS